MSSQVNTMDRVATALLAIRVTSFAMLIVWAFDKFVRPHHGAAVFEGFYSIEGVGHAIVYAIGVLQVLLLLAFLVGFAKTVTYGIVLFMHTASTIVSFPIYFKPYADDPSSPNILFWAAWPVLGALFSLFYLRDMDTRCTVTANQTAAAVGNDNGKAME